VAAANAGAWDDAILNLEALQAADPGYRDADGRLADARRRRDTVALLAEARRLHAAGEWAAVLAAGEQLAALNPDEAGAQEFIESARAQMAGAQRQRDADALLTKVRRLHAAGEWAAVLAAGEQLAALDPDEAGAWELIESARDRLGAQARAETLDRQDRQAVRQLDSGQWRPALGTLRNIGMIEAGYRDTADLLARARHELAFAGELPSEPALACTISMPDAIYAVAFSPDGHLLATACCNDARIWDAASGEQLLTVRHAGAVNAVAFSRDGRRLATASSDHTARTWDTTSGEQLLTFSCGRPVWSTAFSADGRRLLTAGKGRNVRVWDTASGRQVGEVRRSGLVWSAAFSPLEYLAATAAGAGEVRLWDAADGADLLFLNHDDAVNAVAFSSDGHLIATACNDGAARIWDSTEGHLLFAVQHSDQVQDVAFSLDDRQFATASCDGTAQVWQLMEPTDE